MADQLPNSGSRPVEALGPATSPSDDLQIASAAPMRAWLARPFPLWRGAWPELRFVLLAGLAASALVLVTRPFGLSGLPSSSAVPLILELTAGSVAAASFMRVGAPFLIQRFWDEARWTVAHEIAWGCAEIGLIAAALMGVLFSNGLLALTGPSALAFLGVTALCTLPAATIRTLLAERWLRDRHERLAADVMSAELRSSQQPAAAPPRLRIAGQDGSLEISAEALRLARAEENYVEIIWFENAARRRRLLRCTLADVARQLGECALRCHRSYLVSPAAVAAISGNAQGYRLTLFDIADEVPVSRARAAEFFAELRQRRSPLLMHRSSEKTPA
jgi:hypothetical protein